MKYLNILVFTAFEMTILLISTSQIFIVFFHQKSSSFATFVSPNLNIVILSKKNLKLFFSYLIRTFIVNICYSSSSFDIY